ncbi:MAG TPA: CHAT domain-containing tetratricopeptide repeat protein [Candidatus Sulfotelmatobacter sp.]
MFRLPMADQGRIPRLVAVMFAVVFASVCSRHRNPQTSYDHAVQTFRHGNMAAAADEAQMGYEKFHSVGAEWAWKFTILKARVLYRRGMNEEVLKVLASEPAAPPSGELAVQRLRWEGLAYVSLHRFLEAEQKFGEAELMCRASDSPDCAAVIYGRGTLEMERGRYSQAQRLFESVLASAHADGDPSREANALLDLSWSANEQTHFDEALDWADAARQIAVSQNFAGVRERALGDIGWAYYKLGDPEKAERMFIEAEGEAAKLGQLASQVGWLTALGYVYLDARNFNVAEQSFRRSLKLSQQITSREDTLNSLIALAFVSEQTNKFGDAKHYADEALSMARADNNGRDMVYPLLVQGRVAARQHDTPAAEKAFHEVADSPDVPVFLKWEAERSLAHLYEDENRTDSADAKYRTALSTFEAARCALHQRVDSRLPFLSNAQRIYDDYVHFLVAHGKTGEALQVADYDRGKTLSEGLGMPCKPAFAPAPLNAQDIARRAGGTILFYWLGEKQSYLWAITPRVTRFFQLAPSAEIDAAVHSYRTKLEGPPEILEASNDGATLYHMLVEPAQDFLAKEISATNNQVFIIPDGSLNSLNFETLIPETQPKRYWIEDMTITSAGSLHLLSAARPTPKQLAGKLLLIGDPISPTPGPNNPYPELPGAQDQMHSIEQHFPAERQTVFTRAQAMPAAHLNIHPDQFSYIHFVAHGTASRTSPLDSAIILSRDPSSNAATEDDSFKLYARDIIQHPLHAELVTISACYGAGRRSYSGEGLVGLSWAFLRAGAHNVVGALWDVSSVSTPQLMDTFYGELEKGKSPSGALRTAKLGLLHSSVPAYRRPFYWAPFQLYTGAELAFPSGQLENNMR